uniref:Auxin-induced protein 6B n=1 Tax=Anthurium amnicola TaxID=1678845 RepID=A0A1D1Y920_9ARAE
MQEGKKMKVKKGWLAVEVGLEGVDDGFRRFVIPISYLYHPQFRRLLEMAQEVYGYNSSGPLKLPCSVDDFLHLRWLIEREPPSYDDQSHRRHSTLSLHSC